MTEKTPAEYRAEARACEAKAEALEAKADSSESCGCAIAKEVAKTTVRVGILAAIGLPASF